MNISDNELKTLLDTAGTKVSVGKFYHHYKKSDLSYKVLSLAFIEQNMSICVIYEAQYGEKLIFVRPLSGWLDKVEWQDKFIDRFILIT
jgi:hypothetical protein